MNLSGEDGDTEVTTRPVQIKKQTIHINPKQLPHAIQGQLGAQTAK